MLPLKDVIPPRRFPRLSTSILVAGTTALLVLWMTATIGQATALLLGVHLLYLCVFADNVEDRLGRWGLAALWVLAHAAGTTVEIALAPEATRTFGITSGVVAGILGAYLVLYPTSRVLMLMPVPLDLIEVPAPFIMALYFILHIAGGLASLAQVGAGFVTGAVLCAALRQPIDWTVDGRR